MDLFCRLAMSNVGLKYAAPLPWTARRELKSFVVQMKSS